MKGLFVGGIWVGYSFFWGFFVEIRFWGDIFGDLWGGGGKIRLIRGFFA
jgi:hypothetical protein